MRYTIPTGKRVAIPTAKRLWMKHRYLPPIMDGLLFVAPLLENARAIYDNGKVANLAASNEGVDADGTYVDPGTSLITQAQANVLRIGGYSYATRKRGAVLGGLRENKALHSGAFSNAVWDGVADAAVTDNTDVAPNGATVADTITDDNAGATEFKRQSVTIANDVNWQMFSIYLLKDNDETRFPEVDLVLLGGTAQYRTEFINTKTGATEQRLAPAGTTSLEVRDEGNWWRVIIGVKNNSTGNTTARLDIYPAMGTVIGTPNNAATGSIVIWGAQLEQGAFPSSYIPTTTSSKVRATDVLRHLSPGNIATAEGTIMALCTPQFAYDDVLDNASAAIISTWEVSQNNGVMLDYVDSGNYWRFIVRSGGSTVCNRQTVSTHSRGQVVGLAGTWKLNEFRLAVDGVFGAADTGGAAPTTHGDINIGTQHSATLPWFGCIALVLSYNRVLLASEVAILDVWMKGKLGV